jgi:hypothetical protein
MVGGSPIATIQIAQIGTHALHAQSGGAQVAE